MAPLTAAERSHLTSKQINAGFRLACQARIDKTESLVVTIPTASRETRRRVQLEGIQKPVLVKPAFESVLLRIPGVNNQATIPDTERVLSSLIQNPIFAPVTSWEYPLPVIAKTPHAVRKARGEVILIIRNQHQILDILGGDTQDNICGVALDIGTSKLVASLYSLVSGNLIASEGIENP